MGRIRLIYFSSFTTIFINTLRHKKTGESIPNPALAYKKINVQRFLSGATVISPKNKGGHISMPFALKDALHKGAKELTAAEEQALEREKRNQESYASAGSGGFGITFAGASKLTEFPGIFRWAESFDASFPFRTEERGLVETALVNANHFIRCRITYSKNEIAKALGITPETMKNGILQERGMNVEWIANQQKSGATFYLLNFRYDSPGGMMERIGASAGRILISPKEQTNLTVIVNEKIREIGTINAEEAVPVRIQTNFVLLS